MYVYIHEFIWMFFDLFDPYLVEIDFLFNIWMFSIFWWKYDSARVLDEGGECGRNFENLWRRAWTRHTEGGSNHSHARPNKDISVPCHHFRLYDLRYFSDFLFNRTDTVGSELIWKMSSIHSFSFHRKLETISERSIIFFSDRSVSRTSC